MKECFAAVAFKRASASGDLPVVGRRAEPQRQVEPRVPLQRRDRIQGGAQRRRVAGAALEQRPQALGGFAMAFVHAPTIKAFRARA